MTAHGIRPAPHMRWWECVVCLAVFELAACVATVMLPIGALFFEGAIFATMTGLALGICCRVLHLPRPKGRRFRTALIVSLAYPLAVWGSLALASLFCIDHPPWRLYLCVAGEVGALMTAVALLVLTQRWSWPVFAAMLGLIGWTMARGLDDDRVHLVWQLIVAGCAAVWLMSGPRSPDPVPRAVAREHLFRPGR